MPLFLSLQKIIYLDADTLILKDLTEMYQAPFNNNYILGFLDVIPYGVDYLGVKSEKYINDGVVLINLEKIREDKKYIDLIQLILNHTNLHNVDQTAVNYILYPNIGRLPPKFGIFNFKDELDIDKYAKNLRQKINATEYKEALNDPGIIHLVLCSPKCWRFPTYYAQEHSMCRGPEDCLCIKYHNLWHNYANKTAFYDEIIQFIGGRKS